MYGGIEEAPEDPTPPYIDLHPEHKLASGQKLVKLLPL